MNFATRCSLCACQPDDPKADMYDELAKQPSNAALLPELARRRPIWAASAMVYGRCCRLVFVRCRGGVYAWRYRRSAHWEPVEHMARVLGGPDDVSWAAHWAGCKRNAQKQWAYEHYPRYEQTQAILNLEALGTMAKVPKTPYDHRDEKGLFWDECKTTHHTCGGWCAIV